MECIHRTNPFFLTVCIVYIKNLKYFFVFLYYFSLFCFPSFLNPIVDSRILFFDKCSQQNSSSLLLFLCSSFSIGYGLFINDLKVKNSRTYLFLFSFILVILSLWLVIIFKLFIPLIRLLLLGKILFFLH